MEDKPTVIPYCEVLWVLREEGRCGLKGGGGVVFGFDLGGVSQLETLTDGTRNADSYSGDDVLLDRLVLRDMPALLLLRLLTLVECGGGNAGNAVLRCPC